VCDFKKNEIFNIALMDCFSVEKADFWRDLAKQYTQILDKRYLFSFTMNLTQKWTHQGPDSGNVHDSWCWNQGLHEPLTENNLIDWIIPVIQGGIYKIKYNIEDKNYQLWYTLRRSVFRSGCKPFISGINNLGFTANYVLHDIYIDCDDLGTNFFFSTGNIPFQVLEDQDMKESYHRRKSESKNSMGFQSHINLLTKDNTVDLFFLAVTDTDKGKNKNAYTLSRMLDIEKSKLPKGSKINFKKYEISDLGSIKSVHDIDSECRIPLDISQICSWVGYTKTRKLDDIDDLNVLDETQTKEIEKHRDIRHMMKTSVSCQMRRLH
jgi:hypothetical protein